MPDPRMKCNDGHTRAFRWWVQPCRVLQSASRSLCCADQSPGQADLVPAAVQGVHARARTKAPTHDRAGAHPQPPAMASDQIPDLPATLRLGPVQSCEAVPARPRASRTSPSPRCFRIFAANIGPNRCHQNRTVAWPASMPRLCSKSSMFRIDDGKRTYIIKARRMIPGCVSK